MKLKFIGAARTVTGSQHLLEVNGKKILLDSGMFQGKRKESFELNRSFDQFEPEEIDCLVLSHAHVDHCGNIPSLVRRGFNGPIYSTFATRDLASLLLKDSCHIQEKDLEFVNKKRKKNGQHLFEPLYEIEDVENTMNLFMCINYHRTLEILPGVKITFYDAGHILGSAVTHFEIEENGKKIDFGFSGDIGRANMPILRDPEIIPDVDYFICESTYGGRFHDDYARTESKLAELLKKAHQKKSKIIVPAFSVGRTQEILYSLHLVFENNLAPRIPIVVDSPLSTNATDVYSLHSECFDDEMKKIVRDNQDPFGFAKLSYITHVEDSKELNEKSGPMMIISASGMAEAGRVLHHLANNIQNPNNIVLMVGYCAENTLGRKIVEREPEVNIFGDIYQLKAEVAVFNSLSAHADADELLEYCNGLDKTRLKKVFLVHGDYDQQVKMSDRLKQNGFQSVEIPGRGQEFILT
ncbi:MAG: MBL fold metallo-hydrolase [Ignavibacteriaceae bacterium]|nr:MBL fold metallo-hydrolase [Ignavibacteriaceae bacterium]